MCGQHSTFRHCTLRKWLLHHYYWGYYSGMTHADNPKYDLTNDIVIVAILVYRELTKILPIESVPCLDTMYNTPLNATSVLSKYIMKSR